MSLTRADDADQVMGISGLSVAAHAQLIDDAAEAEQVLGLIIARYPVQRGVSLAMLPSSSVRIFRVTPVDISVHDHRKGFAHTDLVTCSSV